MGEGISLSGVIRISSTPVCASSNYQVSYRRLSLLNQPASFSKGDQ